MSINRASLGRGPAIVNFNGATLFTRDDIVQRHAPEWNPVVTSMYQEVDKSKRNLVIPLSLRLWGSWENLPVLFPGWAMNPQAGMSIYGNADTPAYILGRNGDKITYTNIQLTGLANLFLGVDSELWAADVTLTALIGNGKNPEDANAYYTLETGQAYADNAFSKANFKRVRWVGAWGTRAGFTSIVPQKGFNVSWALGMRPVPVDGYGTVDMTLETLVGSCRCIPIQPTLGQVETQTNAQGSAMGTLLSSNSDDLVLSGGGATVRLKSAGAMEHGYAFGVEPLRIGEVGWSTTRGFAGGLPAAVGVIA